ncbi:MAG: fumarylacetoacetate hydrolase family protein [Planctomycetota bacterium]|nr:fumarylacetoacetate hydrolase family protein [Planctomycetota bacterium]
MILFKTVQGPLVQRGNQHFRLTGVEWDALFRESQLVRMVEQKIRDAAPLQADALSLARDLLPPIGRQEVWAAGVTYYRSREARMEEAKASGGGDFYARVYEADRPELFFKATPHRVVGHGQNVRIRKDAKWSVPEPELTVAVDAGGRIIGYTIGNDMCSRDIEGDNPLYLPQAKIYDQSCALGPGILLEEGPLPATTAITLEIKREDRPVFTGSATLAQLKRTPASLVEYLFRECSFPHGCFLMTGTCIVPPDSFTLQPGDEISIQISGIGVLTNTVLQTA